MPNREQQIAGFLESSGWQHASRHPLAGDASRRRYERLLIPDSGERAILMDAPTETCGPLKPFLAASCWLGNRGYSAPGTIACCERDGFLLLEDFGDDLFARIIERRPEVESDIYCAAVDLLVDLAGCPPENGFPRHAHRLQSRLSALALDWYVPAVTGEQVPEGKTRELRRILEDNLESIGTGEVFVHRDYHAENLVWLPQRPGLKRVGILDFQDGSIGHPGYDLVSLLEDARRDLTAGLRQRLLERYCEATGRSLAKVEKDIAVSGAQRNLRILGVFARLAIRDGKTQYPALLPRVWAHLERDLAHRINARLAEFVYRSIPAPNGPLPVTG